MIAIACDHGGYDLKLEIIRYLKDENIEYTDLGCEGREAVDYPVYARKVTDAIKSGTCEKGILICGTGIGISIAANKVPGIRAALCTDCFCVVGPGLAVKIADTFLHTEFSGAERHQRRIDLIEGDKA